MNQMSLAKARIVDPLVTSISIGYQSPGRIARELFPLVTVGTRAGKIPQFNKDNWRLPGDVKHAPGARVPEVQVSYGSQQFSLIDRILHAKVPRELQEEAEAVPGINLRAQSLTLVQDLIANDIENEAASKARNASLYPASNKVTLAGADRWTDPSSDPLADIQAAASAIRRKIGRKPNKLAVSSDAMDALVRHPKLQPVSDGSGRRVAIDESYLARYFQIEKVVVGDGLVLNDDGTTTDLWGQDAILAYVPPSPGILVPAFGYTFGLRGYPFAGAVWWDEDTVSWKQPWTQTEEPHITSVESAFLFVNAGNS